jgi:hypothetical protein
VFRPVGRHAFAAVTWPGLLGVLSQPGDGMLHLATGRRATKLAPARIGLRELLTPPAED